MAVAEKETGNTVEMLWDQKTQVRLGVGVVAVLWVAFFQSFGVLQRPCFSSESCHRS